VLKTEVNCKYYCSNYSNNNKNYTGIFKNCGCVRPNNFLCFTLEILTETLDTLTCASEEIWLFFFAALCSFGYFFSSLAFLGCGLFNLRILGNLLFFVSHHSTSRIIWFLCGECVSCRICSTCSSPTYQDCSSCFSLCCNCAVCTLCKIK